MHQGDTTLGGFRKEFPQTSWQFLAQVQDSSVSVRQAGMEELCQRYWKPIYHFVRVGWAKSNEDAKDLTQAFLLWLVEGSALQRYTSAKASFRTSVPQLW